MVVPLSPSPSRSLIPLRRFRGGFRIREGLGTSVVVPAFSFDSFVPSFVFSALFCDVNMRALLVFLCIFMAFLAIVCNRIYQKLFNVPLPDDFPKNSTWQFRIVGFSFGLAKDLVSCSIKSLFSFKTSKVLGGKVVKLKLKYSLY